ncbi:hypothetical protein GSI_03911 [Ganoderma sinense ZZ0214-1]|uniref:SAP domain-containing protein n=1 Tax=Ganoderma sinense ZZ0214-1 TaxID=1077348 RepID=A0A2G8SKB5_9APHY|nr:hypothetical protein GSI_03911 [Ganoderma sinense ZZ0214-1]
MEAKLKALKVVDLKDILAKANVTVTGKANKQDLVAKILGAPQAIDVYHKIHGSAPANAAENASAASSSTAEKSEAPPKASAPASPSKTVAPVSSKPVSQAAPQAPAAPGPTSTTETSTTATVTKEDAEAERRKARAARFNVPLVEPKAASAQKKNGKAAANGKAEKGGVSEDSEKLAARAARFGTQAASVEPAKGNGRKRAAPPSEPVDDEELARRKKRAERFGIPLVGA